jgi:hypothetical protein
VTVGFQGSSGRSNSDGEKSDGIPKDIQKSGDSNKGKSIRDWRAGRGSV